MQCPKCPSQALKGILVPLHERATPGPRAAVEVLELDQCPACGGLWFDAEELSKYLDRAARPAASSAPAPAAAAAADAREGRCPRCLVALMKDPAPNNPKVTADVCARCGGLWLDGGELAEVARKDLPLRDRLRSVFGDLQS